MYSTTEENYLKAIYKLGEGSDQSVSTNQIAAHLSTAAASVTDMIKRLSEKELVDYEKYKGVQLSANGLKLALVLVRRHRLWEVFLVDKLRFAWDEVHEIAEQLEHVQGEGLTERLEIFLGNPKFDPHGDPIPTAEGQLHPRQQVALRSLKAGAAGIITGVEDHSSEFLKQLDRLGFALGAEILVVEKFEFDHSMSIKIDQNTALNISEKIAQNVYVKLMEE